MGDKISSRHAAERAGVSGVPGRSEVLQSPDEVTAFGDEFGWPVAIKAAYGGGGRGMKVVDGPAEAAEALESATRESKAYFGRDECYVERYLAWPRHVEMQVIADTHGNTLWLGERDCSAQRRHQKLVEESPAPNFPDDVRRAMGEASVKVARGVRVRQRRHRRVPLSGRRVLLPRDEHPAPGGAPGHRDGDRPRPGRVAAAGGRRASRSASPRTDVQRNGHAIEVRINAENPAGGAFTPSPGTISRFRQPGGPGVRLDAGYASGDTVSQFYDNLVAKLVVWGHDREAARRRMLRAIDETVIDGVATTLPADVAILSHPDFVAGEHSTNWVEQTPGSVRRGVRRGRGPPGTGRTRRRGGLPRVLRDVTAEVDGRRYQVKLWVPDLGDAVVTAAGPRCRPGRGPEAAQGGARRGPGRGPWPSPCRAPSSRSWWPRATRSRWARPSACSRP